MTAAAVAEIAIGMNMIDLMSASYLTRSASTATSSPMSTMADGKRMSQAKLLTSARAEYPVFKAEEEAVFRQQDR